MSELFEEKTEDIVAFSVSEPGAMGPNDIEILFHSGNAYFVDYTVGDNYNKLVEWYPELRNCYWNGPMAGEQRSEDEVVVFADEARMTTIPDGMKHIYLEYGNHLVVRDEYYERVKATIAGREHGDVVYLWIDLLIDAKVVG